MPNTWLSYKESPKQAGAELGQAQVKLEVVVKVGVEVEVEIVVEVGVQLLVWVGWWWTNINEINATLKLKLSFAKKKGNKTCVE